ncbi:unnamed protein product, partial [Gulo gulo]
MSPHCKFIILVNDCLDRWPSGRFPTCCLVQEGSYRASPSPVGDLTGSSQHPQKLSGSWGLECYNT